MTQQTLLHRRMAEATDSCRSSILIVGPTALNALNSISDYGLGTDTIGNQQVMLGEGRVASAVDLRSLLMLGEHL